MNRALIIGDSGGIGGALRAALETRLGAANVDGLSRRRDGLDICDEERVAALFSALDPGYDLIVIATGALTAGPETPEKSIKQVSAEGLAKQFQINAMGPALVLKHLVRLVPKGRRVVIAVLSARVGSITDNRLGGWYGYRASKAALNQVLRCFAIEIGRSHPQCIVVSLHPGTVATRFTEGYQSRHETVSPEVAASHILAVIDGVTVENSGRFYDYAGQEVPW